jgi:hypothetical protein
MTLFKSLILLLFLCWFIKPVAPMAQVTFFANVIYEYPLDDDSIRLVNGNYLHIWNEGGRSFFEFRISITGQIIDTIVSIKNGEERKFPVFITLPDCFITPENYSEYLGIIHYEMKRWKFGLNFRNYDFKVAVINRIRIRNVICEFICGDNSYKRVQIHSFTSRRISRVRKRFLNKCNSDHCYFNIPKFKVSINGISYSYNRYAHPQLRPTRMDK